MSQASIDISIVIVNYNVEHFLKQCLQSVFAAKGGLNLEVWVVDNNSVDGSVKMVKDLFPEVKLIVNTENLGFSRANNLAMEKANGKYQLILNPDTVLEQDTLQLCFDFMENTPLSGAVGVKMIDGEGKYLPESKRGLPTPTVALYKMTMLNKLFPNSKTFGRYHLGYLSPDEINEVDVLSGAFMFIRSSVLESIGYFDEQYFMYGEDIDLSYRITQAGYKNYYFPETTIIHYKGESTKKKTFNYVRTFYNAMIIFARTHYQGSSQKWLVGLISLAIWARASLALIMRLAERVWFPLLDFVLLYGGFYTLAKYWEIYNRYVPAYYPEKYYLYHIPAYILIILGLVKISGGYQFPFKLYRAQRGVLLGSLLVIAIYGLLPVDFRFSRAILLLGSLWSLIAITFSRFLLNYQKTGEWVLDSSKNQRIAVVALEAEYNRVVNMFALGGKEGKILGRISPLEQEENYSASLGNCRQLDDIISIYRVNELVFCSNDLDSKQIIDWMARLKDESIKFKIVPANSNYIVGSHSKNSQGELFSIDLQFKINKDENKIKKRIIDLLCAFILMLCLPLSIFRPSGFLSKFSNMISLLIGSKTLVSYIPLSTNQNLPKLKKGIIHPIFDKTVQLNTEAMERVNFLYAKDYAASVDFQLFNLNAKELLI